MTRQHDVVNDPSALRVVALLSGDDARHDAVRGVLAELAADLVVTRDPTEARVAAEAGAALCVVDDANESISTEEFAASLSGGSLLVLLEPGGSLTASGEQVRHYLARPFQGATLRALCEHLLREATSGSTFVPGGDASDGESPPVTARAPSLFKTRALYAEATRFVEAALAGARSGKAPNAAEVRVLAEKIHTALLQSNRLLLMALEPYERFELPAHCVNVALLAAKIAMSLEWGVGGVLRAIQAGLLHDVGMARLSEPLLHKAGKLTDEEWDAVRQHPSHGAEILASLGEEYEWLRLAVEQEHERMNGQGYPAGLSGDEINSLARVIAVADVFEAFSHPRTYRSLFPAYEALEKVVGLRDESLSGEVVAALVDEISAFPLDSFVLLNTGEIGRVVATNPTNLMRPVVRTVWDPRWQPIEQPRTLDLAEETSVSVARPLHETEIPIT